VACGLLALAHVCLAETASETGFTVDSAAWQAHFEGWVERRLVTPEISTVLESLPAPDPGTAYRVLQELIEARVRGLERPSAIDAIVPRLAARGLSGAALDAARAHLRGDVDGALALVSGQELLRDPEAAHMRAQLRDERERHGQPWQRTALIQEYRVAVSLDAGILQADRARVRIAQLLLDLGFVQEAAAELARFLEPPLARPYDVAAVLTFVEASSRAGQIERSLAALEALPRDALLSDTVSRWLERRADLLFALERYDASAAAYLELETERAQPEASAPSLLTEMLHAYALVRSGRLPEATRRLDAAAASGAEERLVPLAALLASYARGLDAKPAEMAERALRALDAHPTAHEAPLLGAAMIEGLRQSQPDAQLPVSVTALADYTTARPDVGLVTYGVLIRQSLPDERVIEQLTSLARAVPQGGTLALVHDDLAHRLLSQVRRLTRAGQPIEAKLLDAIASELSPAQMEEDALLLALEAFYRTGRMDTCFDWAAVLREREVRPVRRGVGAWRGIQCGRPIPGRALSRPELLALSDSGVAGAFSLAIGILAAEDLVRAPDIEGGIRIYERGLEAFAEPQLIGPALMRLGELHAAVGRDGLARARLTRGLGITADAMDTADPFRKAALVALSRVVARRGDPARLEELIRSERPRLAPWWPSAYGFLGREAGLPLSVEGDDPFARGGAALAESRAVAARLAAVAARVGPSLELEGEASDASPAAAAERAP
jgi:hypothetical protein